MKTGMDCSSRSALKTGLENDIFWSEIESGFGEPGGTPHQEFPGVPPTPPPPGMN